MATVPLLLDPILPDLTPAFGAKIILSFDRDVPVPGIGIILKGSPVRRAYGQTIDVWPNNDSSLPQAAQGYAISVAISIPAAGSQPVDIPLRTVMVSSTTALVGGVVPLSTLPVATPVPAQYTSAAQFEVQAVAAAASSATSATAAQQSATAAAAAQASALAAPDTQVKTLINDAASLTQGALKTYGNTVWSQSSGRPVDGTNATGVDPTGVTECGAAMQALLDANATPGSSNTVKPRRRVRFQGTFKTTTTLVIKGDVDLSDAIINYAGTGTAVQIGSSAVGQLWQVNVDIGHIVCASKPTGAVWTAGTVGLIIRNTYRSAIKYQRIANFETNLLLLGDGTYGQGGVAYNNFDAGALEGGLVNLSLQLANTNSPVQAFVNENNFFGGSYSHFDGVYPQAGMRHIKIHTAGAAASINNNRWYGASLEGGREEFIIECYSTDNAWRDCRFEFTQNGAKAPVAWRAGAFRNVIQGGYGSSSIGAVADAGSRQNWIIGNDYAEYELGSDGGMVMSNVAGGTSGTLTMMQAGWRALGLDVLTKWQMRIAGSTLRTKNPADTYDRFKLDTPSKRITLGGGDVASTTEIRWGYGTPVNIITAPPGSMYMNYLSGGVQLQRWRKMSGTDATGWAADGSQPFATASRPTAANVGVSGSYYDTTLGKPCWSDGTTWRDATGVAV